MLVKDYIKKHGNAHFQSVLTKKGKQKLSHPNWIITDMRFPNELKAVKDRDGISIRVNRPTIYATPKDNSEFNNQELNKFNHPSETALDNAEFDYVIENKGSLIELIDKVKDILLTENIIQ